MKKLATLLLISITTISLLPAQEFFSQSLGGAFVGASEGQTGWGAMYSPRLNIVEVDDELILSLGTHIILGSSLQVNTRSGSSGSATFDAPLMVELNYGHMSSNYSTSDFGLFGGVGFGYNWMGSTSNTNYTKGYGPVANGGIRFPLLERSFTIRASYMYNISASAENDEFATNANVFTVGLAYNFGYE